MDIHALPPDCFLNMLGHLSIDSRIRARKVFPTFEECFSRMGNITRRRTTFGLEKLKVAKLLSKEQRMLCTKFSLTYRWECSAGEDHMPSDRFSSNNIMMRSCDKCGNALLQCVLKKTTRIESLDLRGITLTVPLLETILQYCPNICCLRLNFSSFDSPEALNQFATQLAPKIKHLSCDNLFIHDWALIFSEAINLEEAEITIFPDETTLPEIFVAIASEKLDFLSLRLLRTKTQTLRQPPSQYLAALYESKAKNLQHFRIKSNYSHQANYEILLEARAFHNLKSVNFNFMSFFYKPNFNLNVANCWPQLLSLAIDLYFLRGSNKLLATFLEGEFSHNLENLTIFDCHLMKRTMTMITKKCPNLSSLTLVDISFKDIGVAFDWLGSLSSLTYLYIRFTLKDIKCSSQDIDQLEKTYHFPAEKLTSVERFLRTHRSIRKIFLVHWPGLQWADVHRLKEAVKERDIYLSFKEY